MSEDLTSGIDLLLVDDEPDFRDSAQQYFVKRGYRVNAVASGNEALQATGAQQFDVAVVDVHMPEMDGVQLLEKLRISDSCLQVIMLTGGATVPTAVASLKAGAVDYVTKPIRLADLDRLIQKAAGTAQLMRENTQLRHVLQRTQPKTAMVGESNAIKRINHLIERIAPSDKPVLIEGESGTGKELVARAIHANSPLREKPLVVINCAALPESLLESELFGHEKGAFTGAVASKPGLFEIADGGTLFIDEFGELAGSLQAKLLRVLEDGVIRRVGSVKERRIRVRLIAATNKNLADEVRTGRFREDLYYRVNVLSLNLPPLRERHGDICVLTEHFLGPGWKMGEGVMRVFEAYDWPGNVRQLLNALERAKVLAQNTGTITIDDLPAQLLCNEIVEHVPVVGGNTDLDTLNRVHVLSVLKQHHGNKSQTAKALGINRRSLYRLLEKYGTMSSVKGPLTTT
ncbi:MAG: sigma-54-dependent Fis family transcriptional regulator [Planctomycetales bacterium]|nr:sigma-54-dependent Fis family transcriptional regulator [Planctomycetales bacterium]